MTCTADGHKRQQYSDEHRNGGYKRPFVAAAYRAQNDQAVGEDPNKGAEHCLVGSIPHEVAQDPRGVLT